ncbi:hypothetical protein TRFO_14072 [Tritrichomonas foetus]|uniref:Uncharacterized protein n=1 Tax=Tritrichomonas foetus TaxID=1144522 RepID=A0A1J4KW49_9EUKA|nr:hypothetical protein TRFO_14072 [Tritrichomonas foetus]|eukprot:OHT15459.1 hypothetical protein TRFO_14072 [Tritrichomonas foetus]
MIKLSKFFTIKQSFQCHQAFKLHKLRNFNQDRSIRLNQKRKCLPQPASIQRHHSQTKVIKIIMTNDHRHQFNITRLILVSRNSSRNPASDSQTKTEITITIIEKITKIIKKTTKIEITKTIQREMTIIRLRLSQNQRQILNPEKLIQTSSQKSNQLFPVKRNLYLGL